MVVHLGDGKWMIIDSFLAGDDRKPVALEYLTEIGVDASTQVELILVTHWHNDHCRGAAELLKQCGAARFVCSMALLQNEFFELIERGRDSELYDQNMGLEEFELVLKQLELRQSNPMSPSPSFAVENTIVWSSSSFAGRGVVALSPSGHAIRSALSMYKVLSSQPGAFTQRFPRLSPNDCSIALHLEIGKASVLLGADLETGANPHLGWHAVVGPAVCPQTRASVFKVAHHGSVTGEHPGIWSHLLIGTPTSILTPYASGRSPLPKDSDVARLKTNSSDVYITNRSSVSSDTRTSQTIDKTTREMKCRRQRIRKEVGHVRVRLSTDANSSPQIDTFHPAFKL